MRDMELTEAMPARGPSARDRLLAAADDLFYAEGVHRVGINRVTDHAGVARASLYNAFANKEELVAAYLAARHTRTRAELDEAVGAHTDPRARLLAVFDAQARWIEGPTYRGCAFALATAESPREGLAQRATDAYRTDILELLTTLASQAGAANPAALGRQLHLVFHGAATLVHSEARHLLAAAGRSAAEALLDAATANPDDGPRLSSSL